MVAKKSGSSRASILANVTTPLSFFTLGLLVIEGILGALAARASGTDFTILLIGLLVGFLMLILMVFYLTTNHKFRNALLGKEDDESLGERLSKLHLSRNDLQIFLLAANWHGDIGAAAHDAALSPDAQPSEIRLKRLRELGLIVPGHGWTCLPGHVLTRDGTELANLIEQSVEAAGELKQRPKGAVVIE